MKKIEHVFVEDEDGTFNKLSVEDFKTFVIEDQDVEDVEVGDDTHKKEEVVDGIFDMVTSGVELMDEVEHLKPLYDFISEKLEESQGYLDSEKEKAKDAKEAKKKEREKEKEQKEKEKAELAERKDNFFQHVVKGADKAAKLFEGEVARFGKGLPKGITIATTKGGKGFGIEVEDGTGEDKLAEATGYLLQQSENSTALARTSGFLSGDICNRLVKLGLFPSKIQASKFISTEAEKVDKKISAMTVQGYARMAERIPLEYRNNEVEDKAYLNISNAKVVQREKGEDRDDFRSREKAQTKDRLNIAKKVASGEITEPKKIQELVDEMQIKHGLKEKPDPNKKSIGEHLKIYFTGTELIENIDGVHEENEIQFQEKGSKDVYGYPTDELKELVENSRMHLLNALVAFDLDGTEITLDVLKEGKATFVVQKLGVDGKPDGDKTKKVKRKVYPRPFFEIPKSEETPEEEEEEEEEEESEEG